MTLEDRVQLRSVANSIFKDDTKQKAIELFFDRAFVLLNASYNLLNKQVNSPYVLDLLAETVYYDGTECDGNCLMEDIDNWIFEYNAFLDTIT